ncbi:uncharacterized protein B0H18DRAFT_1059115 [Fomitopsis serialis]|uniref:uncharacterized protein n=1 Tax=Fomitopsis serialis TaxID=139415 RepID=UPI0020087BB3|nr:uncharacterized protein B0H18DRAFT_1059115 [Neoantrodia serialis]KAH9911798.1 hypothetical protein B0H18DRAFT_1059115 [Neoantrodia serialis]
MSGRANGQGFFLGFVCFRGPGLFNALDGLGGGGEISSAIYATFAFTAFFAGCVRRRPVLASLGAHRDPLARSTMSLARASHISLGAAATPCTSALTCASSPRH